MLLSAVVEAAAGTPFVTFLSEKVLRPLGMVDTFKESVTIPPSDAATSYNPRFAAKPSFGLTPLPKFDYSCHAGSNGFLSTPSDLVRFGMAPQQEYEAVSASVQAPYAGTYDSPDRPRLTVIFEDGKLFARAGDDPWFRMYPSSTSEFFAVDSDTRWTFVKTPGGRIQEVIARTGNHEVHRRRLP